MDHFLCEVFDIPNTDYIKVKELFDFSNLTLIYDKIYEHPRILTNLVYGFAWLSIFGIYPSKIDVFSLVEKQDKIKVLEANSVIQNVISESKCTFIKISSDIVKNVSNFIQSIKIKINVKKQLVHKMIYRLNPSYKNTKINEMTLLAVFLELCNIKKVEQIKDVFCTWNKQIKDHELLSKNVLTNNYLYNFYKNYTDLFTTLSLFECISRTMYSDLYMLRMLLQSTFIYIKSDADPDFYVPMLNSIAKNTRSLFIVERKYSENNYAFYNHPKCIALDIIANNLDVTWQNIWLLIPKLSPKNILVTKCAEKTYEEFDVMRANDVILCESHQFEDGYQTETMVIVYSSTSTSARQKQNIKGLFTIPILDLDITDLLMKYLMGLQNPYKFLNTQNNTLVVFDMIARYYASLNIDTIKANKIKPKSDYVIVLIDNRDNPMSIMSSYISLSNLKDQVWSMVIITSDESIGYYEKHCPLNSHVISHPILNKKPFDIEMYNALLKDDRLWEVLNTYGKYCLMIQDDGIIIKKGIEDLIINRQVKYDYIGAAWRICAENNELADMCHTMIGNGGLSFRNCEIMLKVCQECTSDKYLLMNKNIQPIAEDVFFSKCVEKVGGKIAPMDIALKFAFEQVMFKDAFGFHKFWVYHHISDVDAYIASLYI